MTLPWVSRARFEDALKANEVLARQVADGETERRRLLDRISLLRGEPPLYSERPVAVAAPALVAQRPRTEEHPDSYRPPRVKNRKELLAWANGDAARRARVGAPSIIAEMNEAEARGRKMAVPPVAEEKQA